MKRITIFLVVSLFISSLNVQAITAYKARDIARREVNDVAKDKLIEIFGPKASGSVTPIEWHILFYDPYAKQDGRLVKVVGDSVVGIEQGYTQLDQLRLAAYKLEEVVNPRSLKIDSDRVIGALTRSTSLRRVKISAMEMRLRKPEKGDVPALWYVTLYARNPRTSKEVKLGTARISASSGQIFEMEIDFKKLE